MKNALTIILIFMLVSCNTYTKKEIEPNIAFNFPVKMCIEHLNAIKLENKPFEYVLFPSLGHNTNKTAPIEISVKWIKQKSLEIKKNKL